MKSAVAAVASVAAIGGIGVYVAAPSVAKPAIAAAYRVAPVGFVDGVVRTPAGNPLRAATVRVVFRRAGGRLVRKRTVRANSHGRFSVRIPRAARMVRVTAYYRSHGARRRVTSVFQIRRGRSLELTISFPTPRSGLLPGIFPY